MSISLADFTIFRLEPDSNIKPFDCGDDDLNNFLHNDSKKFLIDLFAVTYICQSEKETIAYWAILNDRISFENFQSNRKARGFFETLRFPQGKQFDSYPAIKIGRFGVSNEYQKNGLGKQILDNLKLDFVNRNKTGCKFITVDAYTKSLNFYTKNGFSFLSEVDRDKDTRQMFFELTAISNSIQPTQMIYQ